MTNLFFFFIGFASIIVVFIFYVKWLILYAKFKKCTVSDLYSKGIVLPFKIINSKKETENDSARKLNKTRELLFAFLILAVLIAILFNLLHEVRS